MDSNFVVLIVGASGAGKTTIIKKILETKPEKYHRVSTYTTRAPREDERNGEQYMFINKDEYMKLYNKDKLLACSTVDGNYYGAPKIDFSVEDYKDKYLIMDIGAKGAKELKKTYKNVVPIYIIPPTLERLLKQMKGRGKSRLERSKKQLEIVQGVCEWLIINDSVEDSAEQIDQILSILSRYKNNFQNISRDEINFLFEKNLYNKKNIEFLNDFYTRENIPIIE